MRIRNIAAVVGTAVLLSGYAVVAGQVLHPHVGRSYRAYFLDHTTSEWHTQSYSATLADGIRFSRPGKPTFIRSLTGISRPEPSGRWTDARLHPWAIVRYKQPFAGDLCVQLDAAPAPDNVGGVSYVRVGAQSQAFTTPSPRPAWHRFTFHLAASVDTVEVLPGVTSRRSAGDPREIGLALVRLVARPGTC